MSKSSSEEVPFKIQAIDQRLNWVIIKNGESVRDAFMRFHKRAPKRPVILTICHPETTFGDDIGFYSAPVGAWRPVSLKV